MVVGGSCGVIIVEDLADGVAVVRRGCSVIIVEDFEAFSFLLVAEAFRTNLPVLGFCS